MLDDALNLAKDIGQNSPVAMRETVRLLRDQEVTMRCFNKHMIYYSRRKKICLKIYPAHSVITKRGFILRGSYFCSNITCHSALPCIIAGIYAAEKPINIYVCSQTYNLRLGSFNWVAFCEGL